MKAIQYTGRTIRVIIVLAAISLIVELLVPAGYWAGTLQRLSTRDAAGRASVVTDSVTDRKKWRSNRPDTEEFELSIVGIDTALDEVEEWFEHFMHKLKRPKFIRHCAQRGYEAALKPRG